MSSIVSPVLCLQVIRHSLKEKKGGCRKGVSFSLCREGEGGGGQFYSWCTWVEKGKGGTCKPFNITNHSYIHG